MVENSSLCVICTSKVNICCNLRIDYEDKYNSECLQKILSYSKCLLCECSNSTFLIKTQAMPVNILQQIELFMNSTSFPESYSNSVICLTCFHFLNIWHEVRSSVVKLKQNDENYGASDNSNKSKTTKNCTTDRSNEEKLTLIDLVNSDAQVVENINISVTHSSFKTAGSIPDDEENDLQNEVGSSSRLRSESPSLIFSKKFGIQQKTKQLLQNKYVIDKENLISDSSSSEIYSFSKIVDEIVEGYNTEEYMLQPNSLTFAKNFDGELSITTIQDLSDNENESITTSNYLLPKSLNFLMSVSSSDSEKSSHYFSATSSNFLVRNSNWKTTEAKFPCTMEDSPGSGTINENNSQKLKPKSKFRRLCTSTKASSAKRYNNENQGKETTVIDNSSDSEEGVHKNTRKFKLRRPSIFSNESTVEKSVNDKQEKTKIDTFASENDENITERKKQIPKPKTSPILKTQENNSFNEPEQTIESEVFSDITGSTQKELLTFSESEITLIDNFSYNERKSGTRQNNKSVKDFESLHRKISTDQQIVLSDSSDQDKANTVSKGKDTKIRKHPDSLWFYLNKKLDKLQSVEKLHKIEEINLPKHGLDDKFYKQLPYVLLNKDEAPNTKMVKENLPKIYSNTIAVLDNESPDIVETSFGDIKTWCCRICDKTSKTLCEHKAHELFHIKPEQVVINVVRENLKQLQDCRATENINKILSKYVDITERQETGSNGQASGQNTTNVVDERKRKLSILVNKNNSEDKSDQIIRTPKKVRFTLDNNNPIVPNLQSTEDLYLS